MAERIKYCRQCGTQMDQDAKFCGHCGYRFETTKGQKPAARFCPQCGNEISADEKFCPACGQRISKAAASAADPSPVSSQQNRDNQRYSQPVRNRQTSSYPSKPAPASSGRSTASGIPKKKHPIIPIILGVVVLLLGFFYWVSSTTDGSQTEAKAPATTTQGSHTGTTPFGADSSNVQAASDAAPSFPSLEEYAEQLEADGNIEAAARVCALIPKTAASDLHEVAREEFPLIEKAQDLEQIRSVFGASRRKGLPDTADGSGVMETAVSDGSSDPRTPENQMSSENDTQGMPTGEELAAIAKELSTDDHARATEFDWFLDYVNNTGYGMAVVITDPARATRIHDLQPALYGGWKAFICTENGTYGSGVERYLNANIEASGGKFNITLNWRYLLDPAAGGTLEETGSTTYRGTYDDVTGIATAETSDSRIDFDGFYLSTDGRTEYATGTFRWISGETDRIALMRTAQ